MKKLLVILAVALAAMGQQTAQAQGSLTPPGAPAPTQKSLQEIWDAIQGLKSEVTALVQQAVPSVPGMATVLGGTMPSDSLYSGQKVATFYIGKFEVTWDEWREVRDWAVNNTPYPYTDLEGVGSGVEGSQPVRDVNWYDVVKWCNAKSEMEGLVPMYLVDGDVYRTGSFDPVFNSLQNRPSSLSVAPILEYKPNGYRLPTDAEWEWAARGGVYSQGYAYSGSDILDEVGWYQSNSPTGPNLVGNKAANELGIHDMSGNVWEWCGDVFNAFFPTRHIRGGAWDTDPQKCAVSNREGIDPLRRQFEYPDTLNNPDTPGNIGFRIARSY